MREGEGMKYGSLFTGVGGFDLAFDRAGHECAWQVEINASCRDVLARHWPDVKRYEDVKNVGRDNLEPVDIICGGFPCQDVSIAGRRAGLDGERSGLWFEFHRILDDIKPRWAVIENVAGLLSSNGGRDFAEVVRGLVECGYGVSWRILDSKYFGVAQRRRRVFIVASFGNGSSAQVLFEREGLRRDTKTRRKAGAGVAGDVAASLNTGGNKGFRSSVGEHLIAFGGNNTAGAIDIATACNAHGGNDRSYPVRSGDYSGSVSSSRVDAVSGNFGVRRLTPIECERLQGFPDNFTSGQSDSSRYRMMGNAVCVPVAEWIARRMA